MKKRIAITSVLKPIDDPRNYKKIGISLAETNKYEVNIIGHACKNTPTHPKIKFHPVFKFKRLSFKRIFVSWKIYKTLIKVKPDIIIVNTHELLLVTLLYQIIFGSKIVYDVQENYYQNIRQTQAFPPVLKQLVALYVRAKEWLASPFVDLFLLAEKCYLHELKFTVRNAEIIENKFVSKEFYSIQSPKSHSFRFVYTGTIAEEYGIFDALHFIRALTQYVPNLHFTIAGYCHSPHTLKQLKKETRKHAYINLIGDGELLPHNEILNVINESDFAVLPYRLNTYYSQRIPTKIYECLSLKTPMIVRDNPAWNSLFEEFDAFVITDFRNVDKALVELIVQKKFYTKGDICLAHWESEDKRLVNAIGKLF